MIKGISNNKFKNSKFYYFITSIRLRVFFYIVLAGLTPCILINIFVNSHYEADAKSSLIEGVNQTVAHLSNKIISNAFLANSNNSNDLSKELDVVSEMYEGRILVTDSHLRIVYDTFGVKNNNVFLISEESIKALKNKKSEYTNEATNTIELSYPIIEEGVDDSEVYGTLIISVSTAQIRTTIQNIDRRIWTVSIFYILVLIICSYIIAKRFGIPFKMINKSLQHIGDGYIEDKVDIYGYSEMKRVSDNFNDMLLHIAKMEESRKEFVSNVSHELKTPITSVKVLADSLLSQEEVPAEMYREFLSDITAEIDRENQIITDLLELVKLDKKNGDMHVSQVDINQLVEIIMKRIQPIAQKRNIELVYESFRPVIAEVDEVKLSLALNNLIENAVKYNIDNGRVIVSIDSDHKYFLIKVKDTGIGIPKESIERIFDRFYRVDKTRSRETGGTGLGLAITKNVIVMHNGSIKVNSVDGEGSEFSIRIPMSYIPPEI